MIVRSATGPVDLSRPENIRRGMVFRLAAADKPRHFVATERATVTMWQSAQGILFEPCELGWRFLGCDPAHAARGDCERFGLAPGIDAGAHGLARTREGFAVDLRRECIPGPIPAGTIMGFRGERCGPLPEALGLKPWAERFLSYEARFVGLDARLARAEDFKRLCCRHRDPRGYLCSLALGEHEQHEDIAAGVKWAAETEPLACHSGPTCGGTVAITVNGKTETVRYERETSTEKMEQAFREAAARASEQGDKMTSARVRGLRSAEAAGTMSRADRIPAEVAITGDLVAARAWTADGDKVWSPGKASGLCPHCKTGHMERWMTTADYMSCVGGCGRTESAYDPAAFAPKSDAALRERIRTQQKEDAAMRRMLGIAEPGTPDWIRAKVRSHGFGCKVERGQRGPGTLDVIVYSATVAYCDFLTALLKLNVPVYVSVYVKRADRCSDCGCAGACNWRFRVEQGPGKMACEICQCGWCGSVRKETGQACPNAPAIRPRVVVQGDVATLTGLHMDTVHFGGDKVRVWTYDGDKIREMAPSEYDVVRVGPCAAAPDFKVSTAWMDGDTESVQGIGGVLGFTLTGGATNHITLASADGPTWPPSSTAIPAPGTESSLNLTPQAAALRSAMVAIEALPWSAADKRALRDAAHAVCEMAEATDGKAPAMLRGPVTEMLAALATAAHVGPAVVKDAELARGAAALMMPKRRTK